MGLGINDFRSVLGKVNDGNVVFTKNEQGEITGIKKANYGRVFTREKTQSTSADNLQVRQAFFNALSNSVEGKLASRDFMDALRARLGLAGQNEEVGNTPLSRREIEQIFSIFDGANAGGINGVDSVVDREVAALRDAGVYDAETGNKIQDLLNPNKDGCMALFRDAESMKAAFGKSEKFNGFSRTQLNRFIDNNFNRLRLMAFDRLYWMQRDAVESEKQGIAVPGKPTEAAGRPDYQRNLLRSLADKLMGMYGRHEELSSRALDFVKCDPVAIAGQPVAGQEGPVDDTKALLEMIFPENDSALGDSVFDAVQNNVLRNAMANAFANAYREVSSQQIGAQDERAAGARAEFFRRQPELAKLLDQPFGTIRDLGKWEQKMLGAKLRGAVLAELKEVGKNPISAEDGLRAVLSALRSLEAIQPDRMVQSLLTTINATTHRNLDENQLKDVAGSCGDLIRSEGFKQVQQAMLVNVAAGRNVDAGLAGSHSFDTLVQALDGKITALLEGPAVRRAMFEAIGKTSAALYKLPDSMRKDDPERAGDLKKSPINDEAAMIGAKCAFLEIMLGQYHPDLKGIMDEYGKFIPGTDAKTGMTEKQRLEKLDELVARFSSADLSDTKVYFEKELGGADGSLTFYKLCRDKCFNMDDVSADGCANFSTMRGYGPGGFLGAVAKSVMEKTGGENEVKTFHDVLATLLRKHDKNYVVPMPIDQDSVMKMLDDFDKADKNDTIGGTLLGGQPALSGNSDSELIAAMTEFGIKISDLGTTEGLAKFAVLTRARIVHGNSFAGLAEWAERVSGIDVRAATGEQLVALAEAIEKAEEGKTPDPFQSDNLAPGVKSTIAFFEGKIKIEEFAIDQPSMKSLLTATRELSRMKTDALLQSVVKECEVGGTKVKLSVEPGGAFRARIVLGGRELPIATNRSAADVRAVLETRVVNHPDEYGALVAGEDGVLPRLVNGKPVDHSVTRVRELCVKVLVAKLGAPSVAFAAMGLEELVGCANRALTGEYTLEDVPKNPPAVYNSSDVVAMQQAYAEADNSVRAQVKLPTDVTVRSLEWRQNNPPTDQTVHTLISELVMNLDTAVYDSDAAKEKGVRLQAVLKSYGPELAFVRGNVDKYAATLPETVRADVKVLLNKILATDVDNLGELAKCEDDVAAFVTKTMSAMQERIAALFDKPVKAEGEQGAAWTRSLEELANVNGLDPKSPNGKFVLDVLKNYFVNADITEKRAMLAAFLRNAFVEVKENGEKAEPSLGKQAGELMKGAGPVFQKMLQGLPIESFAPETQAALRDMKSRLAPIPEPVVKAQLLDLIQSSNGNLLSIEVKKTLGCATVGQALLCHIKTKEHPFTGEDVVIKLLRPNVQTAALREFKVISQIAATSGGAGVVKTFEGQFQTILRELDFTLEAENIDIGKVHYDRPTVNGEVMAGVRSMGRNTAVPAATNALVLEKVSGDTLDGTLTRCGDKLKNIKAQFERKIALDENGGTRTVLQGKTIGDVPRVRKEMVEQVELLSQKRGQLEKLLTTWMNEAMFGSGFIHGDMHAGNVISDENAMTFIDFGNVTRLSAEERKGLATLFLTAGYDNKVDPPAEPFLDALAELLDADGKTTLANERAKPGENGEKNIVEELTDIMKLSTSDRMASKVFAALAVVQRHKVPLPEGINAFMQSLSRLKGAMSQIDGLIEESKLVYGCIEHGPDLVASLGLEEFKGKIPFVDEALAAVANGGKNAEKVLPNEVNKNDLDKMSTYRSKLIAMARSANAKNETLTQFPDYPKMKTFGESGNDFSLFEQLAAKFKDVQLVDVRGKYTQIDGVSELLKHLETAKTLSEKPALNEKEAAELVKAKNFMLTSAYDVIHSLAFGVGKNNELPANRSLEFERVIGRCFHENLDYIKSKINKGVCINFAYGSMMIDGNIMAERDKAEDIAIAANEGLDEAERLGVLRQQKLMSVLNEFRFPNGPASNDELTFGTAVQALAVNLEVARKRLGHADGERLTEGELKFMANYLKNLHQAYDDRTWTRPGAIGLAFAKMLGGTDPTEAYSVNNKNLNPVMRAVVKGGALPEGSSLDLVRLVELMRPQRAGNPAA